MKPWTAAELPPQTGRTALVTGANSGIGYQTALELARKGGSVLLACRNPAKAAEAAARIRVETPGAAVEVAELDVASLASVRAFAAAYAARGAALDVLVNNAGIMAPLTRKVTAEGFEVQMATNHLGHFLLTALLLPALKRAQAPRVVNVASIAHKRGTMDFGDLMSERRYIPWSAYARTKLANLLFAHELRRRAEAAGSKVLSVAAHPGVARTRIVQNGMGGGKPTLVTRTVEWFMPLFSHSEAQGALPILYAAAMPDVRAGEYYGPHGFREMTGFPVRVRSTALSHDAETARRLWDESVRLTGADYSAL